jgi:hypothetical protein
MRYTMRPILFSAVALCCLSLATAANAAPAKPAVPAAPVMHDDPAKVTAARDFLLAYHPQLNPAAVSASLDKMLPRLAAAAKADDPKLNVAQYEKDARQRMLSMRIASLDTQSHVVSRHFTLQELKDLRAFFSASVGKKLVTETPSIVQEIMGEKRKSNAEAMSLMPSANKPAPVPAKKK